MNKKKDKDIFEMWMRKDTAQTIYQALLKVVSTDEQLLKNIELKHYEVVTLKQLVELMGRDLDEK